MYTLMYYVATQSAKRTNNHKCNFYKHNKNIFVLFSISSIKMYALVVVFRPWLAFSFRKDMFRMTPLEKHLSKKARIFNNPTSLVSLPISGFSKSKLGKLTLGG